MPRYAGVLNGSANDTENESCHVGISALREQDGEGDAPPPRQGERFDNHAETHVGVEKSVGPGEHPDMFGDRARLHAEENQRAGTGLGRYDPRLYTPRAFGQHLAGPVRPSHGYRAGSGTAPGLQHPARRAVQDQGNRRRPGGWPDRDKECPARTVRQ